MYSPLAGQVTAAHNQNCSPRLKTHRPAAVNALPELLESKTPQEKEQTVRSGMATFLMLWLCSCT